jgi:16S rRNA (cytidine1402-2'-O)-methyltransferase
MSGILYLIPSTLGQKESDSSISLAAVIPLEVQRLVARLDYFIVENAKVTRAFIKLISATHSLAKPLKEVKVAEINRQTSNTDALENLLAPVLSGQDVGLISDVGAPAIADPGSNLVYLAHACGIQVKPMVGPSSLLLAIMGSGLNGQNFAFNGYLPTKDEQCHKRIKELELRSRQEKKTQLFIETPYRNHSLMERLIKVCQNSTLICVATDLTFPSEDIKTQAVKEWRIDFSLGKHINLYKRPTVFLLLAK